MWLRIGTVTPCADVSSVTGTRDSNVSHNSFVNLGVKCGLKALGGQTGLDMPEHRHAPDMETGLVGTKSPARSFKARCP